MSVLANPDNNALNSTLLPARTTTYEERQRDLVRIVQSVQRALDDHVRRARSGTPPARRRRRCLGGSSLRSTSSRRSRSRSTPQAWNYIYSRGTGNTCDMTLQQTVAINSPLLVQGNLCLQNSSSLLKGPVLVGGNVTMTDGNTIGTAATRSALRRSATAARRATLPPRLRIPARAGPRFTSMRTPSRALRRRSRRRRRLERLVRQRQPWAVLPVHDHDRDASRCSRAATRACSRTST